MLRTIWITATLVMSGALHAAELTVAVAANFAPVMPPLTRAFEKASGHRIKAATGATGQFYAQIVNGAPYAVLLAADAQTPAKLEESGHAVPHTRFTYAVGRLVLWSRTTDRVDPKGAILKTGAFTHIAVANPKLAPYGAAAEQVMLALGVHEALQQKRVEGANITQTFQFVMSGAAQLGFVALSQIIDENGAISGGSAWVVPEHLHAPIRQEAVLLKAGEQQPAARSFLDFLRTPEAQRIIQQHGYRTDTLK